MTWSEPTDGVFSRGGAVELGMSLHWALQTRDKAAKLLGQIADVHSIRPNGHCICKARNCRVARIMDTGLARKLVADADGELPSVTTCPERQGAGR